MARFYHSQGCHPCYYSPTSTTSGRIFESSKSSKVASLHLFLAQSGTQLLNSISIYIKSATGISFVWHEVRSQTHILSNGIKYICKADPNKDVFSTILHQGLGRLHLDLLRLRRRPHDDGLASSIRQVHSRQFSPRCRRQQLSLQTTKQHLCLGGSFQCHGHRRATNPQLHWQRRPRRWLMPGQPHNRRRARQELEMDGYQINRGWMPC